MAIQSSYPMGAPTLSDTVIGVQYEENKDPATKNFAIQDILDLGPTVTGPTGPQGPAGLGGLAVAIGPSEDITTGTSGSLVSNDTEGTFNIPANTMQVGDSYVLRVGGVVTSNASGNIDLRLETVAAGVLVDLRNIALIGPSNRPYTLEFVFTVRSIGATGVASIYSTAQFSWISSGTTVAGAFDGELNSTTFSTLVANRFDVIASWNAGTGVINAQTLNFYKIY